MTIKHTYNTKILNIYDSYKFNFKSQTNGDDFAPSENILRNFFFEKNTLIFSPLCN